MGVSERQEREKGAERLCEEILAKNFPNLLKDMDIKIQESLRISTRINPKRPTLRQSIIKVSKVNDKE